VRGGDGVLLDTFKPTFLIQIEGETLSKDITQEQRCPLGAGPAEFVFEDHPACRQAGRRNST
jgi:hypothetical protein